MWAARKGDLSVRSFIIALCIRGPPSTWDKPSGDWGVGCFFLEGLQREFCTDAYFLHHLTLQDSLLVPPAVSILLLFLVVLHVQEQEARDL